MSASSLLLWGLAGGLVFAQSVRLLAWSAVRLGCKVRLDTTSRAAAASSSCCVASARVPTLRLLSLPVPQMIAAEIVAGVVLATQFSKYGNNLPQNVSIGVLVVICVFIAGFAWSWGPIGWLYPTEIQPLEIRAAAASLNTASNMVSSVALVSMVEGWAMGCCAASLCCLPVWLPGWCHACPCISCSQKQVRDAEVLLTCMLCTEGRPAVAVPPPRLAARQCAVRCVAHGADRGLCCSSSPS